MPSNTYRLSIIVAVLIFVVLGIEASNYDSFVADEPLHVLSGHMYLTTGEFSGGVNNPPLLQCLLALPTLGRPFQPLHDDSYIFPRIISLLFGVGLILLCAKWAKQLYGVNAGIFAAVMVALEPNILAQGHLATLDLGSTFLILLTLYFVYNYILKPNWWNCILIGIAFSGAILSKLTALSIAPIVLIGLIIGFAKHKSLIHVALHLISLIFVVVLAINIAYLFQGTFTTVNLYQINSHLQLSPIIEKTITQADRILPDRFIITLASVFDHASRGHFSYLMEQYSQNGWWYYYPIALFTKSTIPGLLLMLLGLLIAWKNRGIKNGWFIPFSAVLYLVIVMLNSKVNIGIRHVLLVFPLLYIAGSQLVKVPRLGVIFACILAVSQAIATLSIHPHYIAHFNPIIGGAKQGHHWLIDSNIDWGQEYKHIQTLLQSDKEIKLIPKDIPQTGKLLINANNLMGLFSEQDTLPYPWLRQFEPKQYLGYSWYYYELTSKDFEDALHQDPENDKKQLGLVYVYLSEGNLSKAKQMLDKPTMTIPEQLALAEIYKAEYQYTHALDILTNIYNSSEEYLYLSKEIKLLTSLKNMLGGDCDAVAGYIQDLVYYNEDSIAIQVLRDIEDKNICPSLDLDRTVLLMRAGKFDQALLTCREYINSTDDNSDRAKMLLQSAQEYYNAYIDGNAQARYNLAQFLWKRKAYEPAARQALNTFVLDPTNEKALTLFTEIAVRARLYLMPVDWSKLEWLSTSPNDMI